MTQPLVSVIIPTHNRKDMVVRLLKSIPTGTYKNVEIIVVDDASTDGTAGAIHKAFPENGRLQIVRNKTNRHVAGSRNAGTGISKGKYLFYIDDDNVLHKHAIAELVSVFEDDDRVGELGLVNLDFRNKHIVQWLAVVRNMWTTKTYMLTDLREYSRNKVWESEDVHNAFIIRASVIKEFGISFCEKFGIMYEASDVAYRIRKAGFTIKVVRDAIIYHDSGDYMYHFMGDLRVPYVFARNRIIFHSLYSTKIQMTFILLFWIWAFMFFYWYKILSYSGHGNFSFAEKLRLMCQYLKGNIAGLYFVFRSEKLVYPRIT